MSFLLDIFFPRYQLARAREREARLENIIRQLRHRTFTLRDADARANGISPALALDEEYAWQVRNGLVPSRRPSVRDAWAR